MLTYWFFFDRKSQDEKRKATVMKNEDDLQCSIRNPMIDRRSALSSTYDTVKLLVLLVQVLYRIGSRFAAGTKVHVCRSNR